MDRVGLVVTTGQRSGPERRGHRAWLGVRVAATAAFVPGGGGHREVAADGGIFTFGNAQFSVPMGGTPLNKAVVGMAVG